MGIRVTMGQYTADEETSLFPPGLRNPVVVAVVVVLPVFALFLWFSSSVHKEGARSPTSSTSSQLPAAESASSTAVASREFSSSNWGALERRETRTALGSLDTDPDCPEWEGREVYKNLKAMAVYEFRSDPAGESPRTEVLRSLFDNKG